MKRKLGIARLGVGMAVAAALVMWAGCDDDGGGGGGLEVVGSWTTQFDSTEVISASDWAGAAVVSWDNADNWAITQNAADAAFDPGKFSVLVWTEPAGGKFYYCFAGYGLATQADAQAFDRTAADASDPEVGGCAGFAWTRMTAAK
ncbi:MAG: hypothetical protein R3F39_03315 [Myxococcota bacterium]